VKKAHELVTTGSTETIRLSLHDGFNGFLLALLGDRAFLPPSSADYHPRLDASVGALVPPI
jgi:hypothetical protein